MRLARGAMRRSAGRPCWGVTRWGVSQGSVSQGSACGGVRACGEVRGEGVSRGEGGPARALPHMARAAQGVLVAARAHRVLVGLDAASFICESSRAVALGAPGRARVRGWPGLDQGSGSGSGWGGVKGWLGGGVGLGSGRAGACAPLCATLRAACVVSVRGEGAPRRPRRLQRKRQSAGKARSMVCARGPAGHGAETGCAPMPKGV